MLYYDRIDISEGIDLAKSNKRNKFMIYHDSIFNYGSISVLNFSVHETVFSFFCFFVLFLFLFCLVYIKWMIYAHL